MTRPFRIIGEDEAMEAFDWGANCGPFALAAVSGLSLGEIRPALSAVLFDERRYTDPDMMRGALTRLGLSWYDIDGDMPVRGLARVQWEGPWTHPDRPKHERLRQTHWIGISTERIGETGVFDVNCLGNGTGWVAFEQWKRIVVPHIVQELVPGGDGRWHFTHTIEVDCT